MQLPPQITSLHHAGHACLQLRTRHASAILALQGAQLLSWQPHGQRDVFWLSPQALPAPAAIRGGVPVCWPWFARQGVPSTARQHGPARNVTWEVATIHASDNEQVHLSLKPVTGDATECELTRAAPGLQLNLEIKLGAEQGDTLSQTLHTRNLGAMPFTLTQALHSYFAVADASRVGIEGLTGLPYHDRLRDLTQDTQQAPFALLDACDRTYHHLNWQPQRCYTLTDPVWQRRIVIETLGSQALVVWNPGPSGARQLPDVPDEGWRDFFCLEAANAGPDVILLAPGGEHRLQQTIRVLT
jgi:glucose-6-phosphate 1-epimerase